MMPLISLTSKRVRAAALLLALLMAGSMALSACSELTFNIPETLPTEEEYGEFSPDETSGEEYPEDGFDSAYVLGMLIENEDSQPAALQEMIQYMADQTGYFIQVQEFDSYADILVGLKNGEVHMAWLPPATYLAAADDEAAEARLLTNHFGVYLYGMQILANKESGFTSFFDEASGASLVDAPEALSQLEGKRPCYMPSNSLSANIVPRALLAENQITVQDAVILQSHAAIVRALYIKNICDFGATFALTGDPRTSETVTSDLPDAADQIEILWRSGPLLPGTNFSLQPALDPAVKEALTNAILSLAQNAEGLQIISDALNYQVGQLKPTDNTAYDPLRQMLEVLQLPAGNLIGW